MRLGSLIIAASMSLAVATGAQAQEPLRVEAEPVECLPVGDNGVAYAQVTNNVADTEVRLYFRRMHDAVEDLYYVRMKPEGQGRYWGVFPKAEDREVQRHDLAEQRESSQDQYDWAQWWRDKDASEDRNPNNDLDQDLIRERASQGKLESRDWMSEMDDATFQDWLEQLENEPTEYFTSVHDYAGNRLAKSQTQVVEVRDNCRADLTEKQLGEAANLTVGETAYWQKAEGLFHWLCDGIVSRIDPLSILRGDGACRACVIAWWKSPDVLVPSVGVAGVGTTVVVVNQSDPAPVSPSEP